MRKITCILSLTSTLLLLPMAAYAQDKAPSLTQATATEKQKIEEAPFGLKWGMSEVDAKAMGLALTKIEPEKSGNRFMVTGLPKVLSDTELVLLDFGYNDRLWMIGALSKSFDNDPYGGSVRARYNELNNLLENKYGKGKVSHAIDSRLYKDADEFLAGIEAGRSVYATSYKSDNMQVEISIGANSYSSGYYRLRYVNTPLEKEYEENKKKHEADAL